MKKIKFNGKLQLHKQTIAKLNDNQMNNIQGGYSSTECYTPKYSCNPTITLGPVCCSTNTCPTTGATTD
jgi:bacteriocin-like protein